MVRAKCGKPNCNVTEPHDHECPDNHCGGLVPHTNIYGERKTWTEWVPDEGSKILVPHERTKVTPWPKEPD